jgi:hypothetical protein
MMRLIGAIIAAVVLVFIFKQLIPTELGCFGYRSKPLTINDVPAIFVVVLLILKRDPSVYRENEAKKTVSTHRNGFLFVLRNATLRSRY